MNIFISMSVGLITEIKNERNPPRVLKNTYNCSAGDLDKGRRGHVLLGDHGGQVQEWRRLCTH